MEKGEKRIIARLELKSKKLIKGFMMEGLRNIGDPAVFVQKYNNSFVHEIFLEDISASLFSRKIDKEYVRSLSKITNLPLSYCGGINSFSDAKMLFLNGVDKIYLNSSLFTKGLNIIDRIVENYGSQSVGVVIQAKKLFGKYEVFCESGRTRTNILLENWINLLKEKKIGELVTISVDRDGTNFGPDFDLINLVSGANISSPILYGGGIRNNTDINLIFKKKIDGVMISKCLHNNKIF